MRSLLLALSLLLFPLPAMADPCTGGGDGDYDNGAGSAPSPAASSAIRMVSESVDFTEDSEGRSWAVKARYLFSNTRERVVRATLIFPFSRPDHGCEVAVGLGEDDSYPTVSEDDLARDDIAANGFTVRIDGQNVPTTFRSKGVVCSGGLEYPFGYFFVHEFAPQKTVEIDVDYNQRSSANVFGSGELNCPCYGLGFILKTGALWEGPIGEIVLRYHLARPSAFVEVTDAREVWSDRGPDCRIGLFESKALNLAGVPFQPSFECSNNETTLTLRARDAEPTGDVSFLVHSVEQREKVLGLQGCPFDEATKRPGRDCCSLLTSPIASKRPARDSEAFYEDPLRALWECFAGLEHLAGQAVVVESRDGGTAVDADHAGEAGAEAVREAAETPDTPDSGPRAADSQTPRERADAAPQPSPPDARASAPLTPAASAPAQRSSCACSTAGAAGGLARAYWLRLVTQLP